MEETDTPPALASHIMTVKVENDTSNDVDISVEPDPSMSTRLKIEPGSEECSQYFTCNKCCQVFQSAASMSSHDCNTLFVVPRVPLSDATKKRTNHTTLHKKLYACATCGKDYTHQRALVKHLRIHNGESDDICGKSFMTKHDPRVHDRIMHTDAKCYTCDICQKVFNEKRILKQHKMIHSGEKPYKCESCGKGFVNKFNLKIHYKHHTGERPFACEICHKSYIQKSHLTKHYASHSDERPFKCMKCEKSFKHKSNLQAHVLLHSNCVLCKENQSEDTFVPHTCIVTKQHACHICGKRFNRKDYLQDHLKIHTDKKPFKCDTCDKSFNRKFALLKHAKIHTS